MRVKKGCHEFYRCRVQKHKHYFVLLTLTLQTALCDLCKKLTLFPCLPPGDCTLYDGDATAKYFHSQLSNRGCPMQSVLVPVTRHRQRASVIKVWSWDGGGDLAVITSLAGGSTSSWRQVRAQTCHLPTSVNGCGCGCSSFEFSWS